MKYLALAWVNRSVELTDGRKGRVLSANWRGSYARLCVDIGDHYLYYPSTDVVRVL